MKPQFFEDYSTDKLDPLAPAMQEDFNWDELYERFGELSDRQMHDEQMERINEFVRKLFQWVVAIDLNRPNSQMLIGRRFIALAWVLNPALFEGSPSASKLAESLGMKVDTGHSYEAVPLFTPAEQSFFGVLQQAIASDYRIFAKVRLADVIHPVRGISRSGWQSAFNRIIGKHIDFVLCDPQTLRVVLVIELDDKTHKRFERGIRDGMVDAALAGAGIAVLRVPAARAYSLVQIQQQIESLIRLPAQTR